jgi:ferredoxin
MKVFVDAGACIGCGLCIQSCPNIFEWDSDNLAKVKVQIVPPESEKCVSEACENCPTNAISIET